MASNIKYAVLTKNAKLNQISSQIGTSGFLKGYSGTQPANADTALSGNTLLFNLPLSATAFAAASGGVLTANAISTESSADNTGTCTWASLVKSDNTTRICDMSAGTSGADLTLNSASITAGAQISCSGFTITSAN